MAKSSIDRIREAEISAAQRKKQISEELSASLSESRAKAEKDVERAKEEADKYVASERVKSEKEAEEYLASSLEKAKAQAREYCAGAEKNAALHCIHNLFDTCVLALFPRFQYNRQLGTSLITAYTRTASRHILNIFYVWILFQISNSTIGHYARTFQSCSLRQFQFNLEVTLVLYGQKTSRNNTMNQHYASSSSAFSTSSSSKAWGVISAAAERARM